MLRIFAGMCGIALALVGSTGAYAQETVKIGIILPYSGQFADAAAHMDNAIKLYMEQHGREVAGKTIEIIRKDVGGIAPDVAKRLAQELIVREDADILAGFLLTPNALAAGDVSAEAEKFMVVMNAATAIITTKSPYMVRTSLTVPQLNEAFGAWAAEQGIKTAFTMVADYGPGHDAEQAFHRGFTEGGGEIVGSVRMPVANPDFSAFVQRAKDANAEAVYIWVPGGAQPAALAKALANRGVTPENTKILGQGEVTSEDALANMGDEAVGMITVLHYDRSHESEKNAEFVKAYNEAFGRNPDFFAAGAYDGMHLIYEALKKTNGDTSAEALVEAAKGMEWESPRGPVSIDPETRDIVQNVYIREVQKKDGELVNVEIDKVEKVKDPVKARM